MKNTATKKTETTTHIVQTMGLYRTQAEAVLARIEDDSIYAIIDRCEIRQSDHNDADYPYMIVEVEVW